MSALRSVLSCRWAKAKSRLRTRCRSGTSVPPSPRPSRLAVGYVYNLSKRTAIYATGSIIDNDGGAASPSLAARASARMASRWGSKVACATRSELHCPFDKAASGRPFSWSAWQANRMCACRQARVGAGTPCAAIRIVAADGQVRLLPTPEADLSQVLMRTFPFDGGQAICCDCVFRFRVSEMKMHKRFAAALAVAAAACSPALGVTLKWASASDIPTWDIHSQNNALGNGVHAMVYESLFYYNRKFELEPMLATGYQQVSPTQVRITLRKGVKFHDGAAFNADDAVFSLEPRDGQDVELRRLHAGHRQGRQGRRLHDRHLHQGPEPRAAAPAHRAAHDGPRLGREEQVAGAQGHQDQGRELRSPQCQRHRALHAEELGPGREARAAEEPQLVGQDGRQRHRDRLHADQGGGDARGRAAVGRSRHGARPVAGGLAAPAQQPRPEGARRRREPHDLLRHGSVPRRAARLERQGQESAEGRARAQGAVPGDRRPGPAQEHDARLEPADRLDDRAASQRLDQADRSALPVQPRRREEAARRGRLSATASKSTSPARTTATSTTKRSARR